jgi:CHAD domain-containing protein
MRIGLRRLRAAIAVFDDVVADDNVDKIKAGLKWITRELGAARDLDVFAADVLAPLRDNHPEDQEILEAERDFAEKRAAAYARAASAAESNRFRGAMLGLAQWIELGPWTTDKALKAPRKRAVAEHAREELARIRKAIKRRGSDLRQRSVPQRHHLRIRAKRLRYATEFFAGTFPGAANAKLRSESLSALKDLQDALGGLNDLATHDVLMNGRSDDERGTETAALAARLKPDAPREETLLHKAEQAFARFAETKPFWKA